MSFMYDIFNNNVCVSFFPLVLNNMIHGHFTRSSAKVHINTVSTLDYQNFFITLHFVGMIVHKNCVCC